MKKILSVGLLSLLTLSLAAQTSKVNSTVSSSDTADLSIISVFPEKFPSIAVLFKAESRKGEPVWNLTKEKMIVTEGSQRCDVMLLEPISKNKSINIAVVMDHSGSMAMDYSQFVNKDGNISFDYDADGNAILPIGYKTPIDNAKYAVKNFIRSFNHQKDSISIIGFSERADIIQGLTNDVKKLNLAVDTMQATASTALYDAMIEGILQVKKASGIKVLIALTDGYDNSSVKNYEAVIRLANAENIPMYIIGLGEVNKDTLQRMAIASKGQFYYTKSSASLDTVYATISKKIQSFYNLVYESPNFSAADSTRDIAITFNVDSIYVMSESFKKSLPSEVLTFLEKKEKQQVYLIYGGVALVCLVGLGVLLLRRLRKRQAPGRLLIKKLYPNPSNGIIHIDYTGSPTLLQVLSQNGGLVRSVSINGNETQFDLSWLNKGNYIALLVSATGQSNPVQFMIE